MAYISCTFSTMYKTSSTVTEYISINCLIRILSCCHYCCTNKVSPWIPSQCFVMLLMLYYMTVSFFSIDPILHMSNIFPVFRGWFPYSIHFVSGIIYSSFTWLALVHVHVNFILLLEGATGAIWSGRKYVACKTDDGLFSMAQNSHSQPF